MGKNNQGSLLNRNWIIRCKGRWIPQISGWWKAEPRFPPNSYLHLDGTSEPNLGIPTGDGVHKEDPDQEARRTHFLRWDPLHPQNQLKVQRFFDPWHVAVIAGEGNLMKETMTFTAFT